MQPTPELVDTLRTFVQERFPLARGRTLDEGFPLLETGIIDSLGLLEVVQFIESEYSLVLSARHAYSHSASVGNR